MRKMLFLSLFSLSTFAFASGASRIAKTTFSMMEKNLMEYLPEKVFYGESCKLHWESYKDMPCVHMRFEISNSEGKTESFEIYEYSNVYKVTQSFRNRVDYSMIQEPIKKDFAELSLYFDDFLYKKEKRLTGVSISTKNSTMHCTMKP